MLVWVVNQSLSLGQITKVKVVHNTNTLIFRANDAFIRVISAVLGGIVVANTGILQLTKLRESGIVFRIMTSRLQKEYHSFIQCTDNYSIKDDKEKQEQHKLLDEQFIHNSESLIFNPTTEYYDLFRDSKRDEQRKADSQ